MCRAAGGTAARGTKDCAFTELCRDPIEPCAHDRAAALKAREGCIRGCRCISIERAVVLALQRCRHCRQAPPPPPFVAYFASLTTAGHAVGVCLPYYYLRAVCLPLSHPCRACLFACPWRWTTDAARLSPQKDGSMIWRSCRRSPHTTNGKYKSPSRKMFARYTTNQHPDRRPKGKGLLKGSREENHTTPVGFFSKFVRRHALPLLPCPCPCP